MSRCIACSHIMTGAEMVRVRPNDELENMCTKCLIASGVLGGVEEADIIDAENEAEEQR